MKLLLLLLLSGSVVASQRPEVDMPLPTEKRVKPLVVAAATSSSLSSLSSSSSSTEETKTTLPARRNSTTGVNAWNVVPLEEEMVRVGCNYVPISTLAHLPIEKKDMK